MTRAWSIWRGTRTAFAEIISYRRVDVPPLRGTFVEVITGKFSDLISGASAVLNPRSVGDRRFGDVAAALRTTAGDVFTGVCIDTGSGTGFCAEHAAVAAMVTAGQYEIAEVVAVWRDDTRRLHVLPPCGRCREFMRQIDERNLDAEVVLGPDEARPLRDLLRCTNGRILFLTEGSSIRNETGSGSLAESERHRSFGYCCDRGRAESRLHECP